MIIVDQIHLTRIVTINMTLNAKFEKLFYQTNNITMRDERKYDELFCLDSV